MKEWYDTARTEDKRRIGTLHILKTLIETATTVQRCDLRCWVATLHYLLMMGVTWLRGTLPMMPKDPKSQESNAGCAWYGALKARKTTPHVTERNLREKVHYQPRQHNCRVKMT